MVERISLQSWLEALDAELEGITLDEDAMHTILDLARDAAHTSTRPASPLTIFTVGVHVGRGATLGQAAAAMSEKLREASGATADDADPTV